MRTTVAGLVVVAAIAACSRPPTNAAANAPAPAANRASSAPVASAASAAAPAASGSVTGTYVGDGKAATLTDARAYKGDDFDGKKTIDVVLSEKPQAGSQNPATDALFGQFGDALVVHVQADDGEVVGTEVIHSGFKDKGSVSVSGPIKLINYHNEGGQLSGQVTSGGTIDVFDDKLAIDLTFHAAAP